MTTVTQKQIQIPENAILVSRTDLEGRIVECNPDFAAVCGYTVDEMIGQPHKIIRHPDVPAQVFEDMWRTIKSGRSWNAVVKNRAKNGDHYWVEANATPVYQEGKHVGYVSVRTPASQDEIDAATKTYERIRQGKAFLSSGILHLTSIEHLKWFNPSHWLRHVGLRKKMAIMVIPALVISALLGINFAKTEYDLYHAIEHGIVEFNYATKINDVVHELQVERGRTAGYQAKPSPEGMSLVEKQREVTNQVLARVGDDLIREKVMSIRQSLDSTSLAPKYTALIFKLLTTISNTTENMMANMGELATPMTAYEAFNRFKEQKGLERATINAVLTGQQFSPAQISLVFSLQGKQDVYRRMVEQSAPEDIKRAFLSLIDSEAQKHIDALRPQLFGILKGEIPALAPKDWFVLSTGLIEKINTLNQQFGQAFAARLEAEKHQTGWTFIASVLLLFIMISFITWISVSISIRVQRSIVEIERVLTSVDLAQRIKLSHSEDEMGRIASGLNTKMNFIQLAITNVNYALRVLAQGDFTFRIVGDFQGDLNMLKCGVNKTNEQLQQVMRGIRHAMNALAQADYTKTVTISAETQGEYRQILENINATMQSTRSAVGDIQNVMNAMRQGDFDKRVTSSLSGDLDRLKQDMNDSLAQLSAAVMDIVTVMQAQSDGDLHQKIHVQYPGQLGMIATAVNTSASRMADTLKEVLAASNVVRNAAQEVAQGNMELNQRTQQQAASLEETASAMEEISATVQQSAGLAQQASKLAKESQAKALSGEQVMHDSVSAMSRIDDASQQIGNIVGLIDSIAFQTNLLALNAAVEAARAGEHGRGFAVVAGEVRTLAQKSANSARDIKQLVDNASSHVAEGNAAVTSSGKALEDIATAIRNMGQQIQQIDVAAIEQNQGIGQIRNAIAQLDSSTQQNAALVEETTASADTLRHQAEHLQHLLSRFKL